jgi:hypothetical protein
MLNLLPLNKYCGCFLIELVLTLNFDVMKPSKALKIKKYEVKLHVYRGNPNKAKHLWNTS